MCLGQRPEGVAEFVDLRLYLACVGGGAFGIDEGCQTVYDGFMTVFDGVVIPEQADTTTTGLLRIFLVMIEIVLLIAAASPTLVPPNFITIIA